MTEEDKICPNLMIVKEAVEAGIKEANDDGVKRFLGSILESIDKFQNEKCKGL